jgi:hypothetical protein
MACRNPILLLCDDRTHSGKQFDTATASDGVEVDLYVSRLKDREGMWELTVVAECVDSVGPWGIRRNSCRG